MSRCFAWALTVSFSAVAGGFLRPGDFFCESSLYPSPSLSLGYLVGTNRLWGESPRAAPGHPLGDGCLACLPQASCLRRSAPDHAYGVLRTWARPVFVVGHHCPSGMVGSSSPYRWWTSPPTNAGHNDPPAFGRFMGLVSPVLWHVLPSTSATWGVKTV